MAWNGLVLTKDGQVALTKAQLDGRIHIKSIVVGDGDVPKNFHTQKSLVHKLYEITDIQVVQNDEGCMVIGDFPTVNYDYYFREIGVMVVTDEGDKLYVYDNCGKDATPIIVSTGVEHKEGRVRIKLIFSDVAEVRTTIESILYVDYTEFSKLAELVQKKADADGGNISDTVISVKEPESEDKYPEISPEGGVTASVFGGVFRWLKSLKMDKVDVTEYENHTHDDRYYTETEMNTKLGTKVDASGGDIANTKVSSFTASTASYPVPAGGDTLKVGFGKITKFFTDIKNWMTGVCLIGSIVNNCVTNNAKLPLSAAQGKVLMDLYTVLNTKLSEQNILWDAKTQGWVMHENQTLTLSQKVSEQKTGIILCWTAYAYETATVQTYDNNYSFIPKEHVLNRSGAGVAMLLSQPGMSAVCAKYVYIADTTIRGNKENSRLRTDLTNGIISDSRCWVLRKVLGV